MKTLKFGILIFVLFLFVSNSFGQQRSGQWEIFLGAAFPLGPKDFRENFEIGGSFHAQYVLFPSPKLGVILGVAGELFRVDRDLADQLGIDIELSIGEFGIGIRSYQTSLESKIQFFLFGMPTLNLIESKVSDDLGNEVSDDFTKPGVAVGAGVEIPAGEQINIIVQTLFRFIFVNDADLAEDPISFVGITAGVVF